MEDKKELIEIGSLFEMQCQWSVGPFMDEFYAGLAKKTLQGSRCPECEKVYVPPRAVCSKCYKEIKETVMLPGNGKLVNFTVAHVDIRGQERQEPIVIGMVRLKGTYTPLYGIIKGVPPDEVSIGMKLKTVWVDEPKGTVQDFHFEPA